MARPNSLRRARQRQISARISGARPPVASSKSNNRGLVISARPIASICCSPPDSWLPMLAIGRALMTNPRLLILDEATEGLAPLIRAEIWRCLARLKELGLAILVIDKNVGTLTRVADRHFLIERGRVVWSGASRELAAAPDVQRRYLGV